MKKKILKKKSKFLVITSINKPNNVINKYIKLCKEQDVEFVFVSDKKTPLFKNKNLKLLDLSIQQNYHLNLVRQSLITVIQEKILDTVIHAFRCKNDL